VQDSCRESDPTLKSLSLREFTSLLFGHCPGLAPYRHMLDDIHSNFNKYKQTVPTMGAIILDPTMEKVLLVRGFAAHHGWGFPKGKVTMGEADHDCAIREVIFSLTVHVLFHLWKMEVTI
jgi:mRNA-decapping enzyme subunit 2